MPPNLAQLTVTTSLNINLFRKQGSYGIVRKAMSMENDETYVSSCWFVHIIMSHVLSTSICACCLSLVTWHKFVNSQFSALPPLGVFINS